MDNAQIGPTQPNGPISGSGKAVGPSAPGRPVGPPSQGAATPSPFPARDRFDRLDLESLMLHAYAQFTVDPETGIVTVKIIDSKTNEVIRQIPSDALLGFAEEMEAYLAARQRSGV